MSDDDLTIDAANFGPAMAALTPKQSRFVLAMASMPLSSAAEWARAAGYSDHKEGAKVRAHEVLQSESVQAAVLELAKQTLGTVGPMLAARQLIRIASDPKDRNRMKAIEMIAARTGLPEIEQIEVKHVLDIEQVKERIRVLAAAQGLDGEKLINGPSGVDIAVPAQYGPAAQLEALDAEVIEETATDELEECS